MTRLSELLDPENIQCRVEASSKKKALQILAELLKPRLEADELSPMRALDALIAREKLGSTALGHGVAIPHGRIKGLSRPVAALIALADGIDFEAPDNEPVDLVFCLVVPEDHDDEHLTLLARLARIFSNDNTRQSLRTCTSSRELLSVIKAQDKAIDCELSAKACTETDADSADTETGSSEPADPPAADKTPSKSTSAG